MSMLIEWLIVLGLAFAIACIFMLSNQLENHTRSTAEMMLRSNQMLLARLERLTDPALRAPEAAIGVVLEKRHAQRRDPFTQMREKPGALDARDLPRRRIEDLLQA
jgi:hypothetical protein